jgi:subtilisin family serine protease
VYGHGAHNLSHSYWVGLGSDGFDYLTGTHVAGTAGGSRFGIAKRANLIGIRILGDAGTGCTSLSLFIH